MQRSRGGTPDAIVVIRDSPRISLPKSHYTVSEGSTVTIRVAIENPKSRDFTLDYTLSGDTALAADVVGGFGTRSVTVPANAMRVNIPIETVQDTVQDEGTETFRVRLSTSEGGVVFRQTTASVTITDPRISLPRSYYTVSEGGTAIIGVAIENPKSTAFTLDYTLSSGDLAPALPGDPASGADVVGGFGTRSVAVAANARRVYISVQTVQDTLQDEGIESFSVRLSTSEPGIVFGRRVATVSIRDDDSPVAVMQFASASSSADEGAGTHHVTITLSPAPTEDVYVLVTEQHLSATPGSDYEAFSGRMLTVPAGTRTMTVPVTIIDDDDPEGDETILLSVLAPYVNGEERIGFPREHTLTIVDTDLGVSFASASQSASEGSGTRNVTVNLSPAPTSAITVNYTVGGTATAGSDFTIVNSGTLSVPKGATTATIPVAIVDDGVEDTGETVVLTLAGGDGYNPHGQKKHVLTIDPWPEVTFASASQSASEGSGIRNVTVNLRPAVASAITLNYEVGGTATAGSDFTIANSGTLSVAKGATTATIPVSIVDDGVEDGGETVVLTLVGGQGYLVSSERKHVLHIDPVPEVTFARRLRDVDEGAGTIDVRVNLSPAPASAITLNYDVDGVFSTATPDVDYVALPGTLSVPAGSTSATIPVTIIDDTHEDSREWINLKLRGGAGYRVGDYHLTYPYGYPHHTVFILNHDQNGLEGLVQARIDAAVANGDASAANLWRRALAAVRGEAPPNGLAPLTEAEARAQADAETARGNTALASLWTDIAFIAGAAPATPQSPPAVPEVGDRSNNCFFSLHFSRDKKGHSSEASHSRSRAGQ